ncbi:hypothetical protein STEG23_033992 [Scotinomys teguina]
MHLWLDRRLELLLSPEVSPDRIALHRNPAPSEPWGHVGTRSPSGFPVRHTCHYRPPSGSRTKTVHFGDTGPPSMGPVPVVLTPPSFVAQYSDLLITCSLSWGLSQAYLAGKKGNLC